MESTGICVQTYSDLIQIDKRLVVSGYKLKTKYSQTDFYYTHLSKESAMSASYSQLMQNSIILRKSISDEFTSNLMTYKNKTLNSNNEVIKEEKLEIPVINMSNIKRIFSIWGVYNWARLESDKFIYTKGPIEISVQRITGLGNFISIENYEGMQGSSDTKFKQLTYIANSLGLDLGKDYSCKKAYMLYQRSLKII